MWNAKNGSKPPKTAFDCEYDDEGVNDGSWAVRWLFGAFSVTFRDPAEDAFWDTSGAPGELIFGSRGAQLRSNRISFSK